MFRRRGYVELTSRARCLPICNAEAVLAADRRSALLKNTVTASIVTAVDQGEMAVFMSFKISAALKARL